MDFLPRNYSRLDTGSLHPKARSPRQKQKSHHTMSEIEVSAEAKAQAAEAKAAGTAAYKLKNFEEALAKVGRCARVRVCVCVGSERERERTWIRAVCWRAHCGHQRAVVPGRAPLGPPARIFPGLQRNHGD